MNALPSTVEIPGVGVCAHDLRFLAQNVIAILGLESGDAPSTAQIFEHAMDATIGELRGVVMQLEDDLSQDAAFKVLGAVLPVLRCATAKLECAREAGDILSKLLGCTE